MRSAATGPTVVIVLSATIALLAGGCGGDGETKTTTVTVPAGRAGAGVYAGTTDQGLPVSFSVARGAVLDFSFGWRAPCADGKVRSNSIRLGGTSVYDGTFAIGGVLETGGVAQVEGQIDGEKASGTFSRSKGTAFGIDCKVDNVGWHASAESQTGRAY